MARKVIKTVQGFPAVDGDGVQLVRVLGNKTVYDFDPFLMLDSFDTTDPEAWKHGFPRHPHRGIETVTFMSQGEVTHRDNLGNQATVGDGGAQWLTAGSGAYHSEFMNAKDRLLGLQLWLNLPQKEKMSEPYYHSINNDKIQEILVEGGKLRLLTGNYLDHKGFQSPHLPLDYYNIFLEPNATLTIPTDAKRSVMVFTLVGDAIVAGKHIAEKTAVKLGDGDSVEIKAGDKPIEIMLMSSIALNEPIAWYGPIVMNDNNELRQAVSDLQNGTFVKSKIDYNKK